MSEQTALHDAHIEMGAKMVDFAGWHMPINYGSQIKEHNAVRESAGMFDVSHMTVVDLLGERVVAFLQHLLANDVGKLKNSGKALYSCMLKEDGGVIDDLIVYYQADDRFRMVVNAATRDKDLAWLREQAVAFSVDVVERDELAMIAVQGPEARDRVHGLLPADLVDSVAALKPFNAAWNDDWFVGRTGYTGEDGYEVILPATEADGFWRALAAAGVAPIGLGARDTLRLEAGMNLYGTDMDESISPLEAGLNWTVAWEPADRDFIGRKALEAQKAAGVERKLVGLVLEGKGVLRGHQAVLVDGEVAGEITSGGFSPTLGRSIALARVPAGASGIVQVDVRGRPLDARVVKYPFVRNGKSCLE